MFGFRFPSNDHIGAFNDCLCTVFISPVSERLTPYYVSGITYAGDEKGIVMAYARGHRSVSILY